MNLVAKEFVAARDDDAVTTYSSRGPTLFDHVIKPDLVAPGRNVVAAEAAGCAAAICTEVVT